MTEVNKEQDAQVMWDEVAAERTGQPVEKPADPKPVETPAAAEPEVVKPDPLAEITAKLTDLESKIGSRLRNVEGHIGSLNGTQKELKQLFEASKTAANTVADAPTAAAISKAMADPEEWSDLKKEYPTWAAATEKLLDARFANSAPAFDAAAFEARIREEIKGETSAVQKAVIDTALDAVFPGWKDDVKTEAFGKWISTQPENVQKLADSQEVRDAAQLLKAWEESKKANPANQIIEQRKATLNAATSTLRGARTTPASKSWDDMTPEERWDYEKRQRAKRAG